MLMRLERKMVNIMDHENKEVVERFPVHLVREPTAFTSNDPKVCTHINIKHTISTNGIIISLPLGLQKCLKIRNFGNEPFLYMLIPTPNLALVPKISQDTKTSLMFPSWGV